MPKKAKVILCDDSGLLFSDDYRAGWTQGFRSIGCDVQIIDIKPMNKMVRLAGRSSPVSMRGSTHLPKGLAMRIVQQQPDLVFFHHGRTGSQDQFSDVLRRNGIKTCVYLCDEPYEVGETAFYSRKYSHVFTMDPCTMDIHKHGRRDKNVFYLPPGANTSHFHLVPYSERTGPPVFFLGNGTLVPRPKFLKPVMRVVDGADIRFMKTTHRGNDDWVPHREHPRAYGNCKLGLNVHRAPWADEQCWNRRIHRREEHIPFAPGIKRPPKPQSFGTGFWNDANAPAAHWNPRFLEMAACGTLVINDNHRSEMAREFPYVPQASDPEHFLELVLYYLEHLDEAEEIGRTCSYQISKRHTYSHRAAEVLIRLGLMGSLSEDVLSCLGEPQDWLTPQDSERLMAKLSSGQTGPCERWHPRFGSSSTRQSGSPNGMGSIDTPKPWL